MRAPVPEGVFPSPPHALLLRAALLSGHSALRAWRQWVAGVDWQGQFDRASFRLLPLLHTNLLRHAVTHPVMPKLKGIYRLAWYETNQILYRMRDEVEALKNAGVDVMLVKGAPLALTYYRSLGARPMKDVDIVVPTADAHAAVRVLEQRGWRRAPGAEDADLTYKHAMSFIDARGQECDLHWHVLYECCQPDADVDFWQGAEPLDFLGIPVKTLNPADALLVVVVHGMRSNEEPVIRWVADAVTIVREAGARLDWDRLVRQAQQRQLTERLRLGLLYLAREMDVPVPIEVFARLAAVRLSVMERLETRHALAPLAVRSRSVLGDLIPLWASYRRFLGDVGPWRTLAGFPDYLLYMWHLGTRRELAATIAHKARSRARLLFAGRPRHIPPAPPSALAGLTAAERRD
jgi:hypothetical protein